MSDDDLFGPVVVDGEWDCSAHVGPQPGRYVNVPWPMYSFGSPAAALWNAIGKALYEQGWTEAQVKWWLHSKAPRYHLDDKLGTEIEELGRRYAETIHAEDRLWVLNEMAGD